MFAFPVHIRLGTFSWRCELSAVEQRALARAFQGSRESVRDSLGMALSAVVADIIAKGNTALEADALAATGAIEIGRATKEV